MLVDALAANGNIKATFFLVGYHIAWNQDARDIVKSLVEAGHEVALHTWTHHPLTSLTNEQIIAELLYTEAIIYESSGVSPKLLRPPYGNFDNRVRAIAKALGFSIVLWTDDSEDFALTKAETLAKISTWYERAGPGILTLQHDGDEKLVATSIESVQAFPVNPGIFIEGN
jgi:peptidoglycan/xylan/chitin deacetylase (PgdA/CDA1 family)